MYWVLGGIKYAVVSLCQRKENAEQRILPLERKVLTKFKIFLEVTFRGNIHIKHKAGYMNYEAIYAKSSSKITFPSLICADLLSKI